MEKQQIDPIVHDEVLHSPCHDRERIRKASQIATDNELEHDLTLKYVLAHHKALIGWIFFWALCAIGWGFDAQVNGAMISVPAFRRDFG